MYDGKSERSVSLPSPVGHSLTGISLYCIFHRRDEGMFNYKLMATYIFLSNVPDFDYVLAAPFGFKFAQTFHHTITHSIIFSVFCGFAAFLIARLCKKSAHLWFWAVSVSLLLHNVLDYFTWSRGVMLFYPFSTRLYRAPILLFQGMPYHSYREILSMSPENLAYMVFDLKVFLGIALGIFVIFRYRFIKVKLRQFFGSS